MSGPAKPKLADPGALIRSGKLKTAEFRVCMDPDLVDEYEQLLLARDAAEEVGADSLAGAGARTAEADAEISKLLEQMEAVTVPLILKALARPEFRSLIDQHPPRKDAEGKLTHAEDAPGVNFETFYDALIRASLVSPVLDEDTLNLLLNERLTDRQWQDLTDVCWNLNRTSVNIPFSPAVSPSRRNSSPR